MRYYVVADVHGFYSEMEKALQEKGFFTDTEPHKVVMLGDLFDRGREAEKMQKFVLELMEKEEVILIRGNHEDLFEDFVTVHEGRAFSHHISNGTYDTALQLTGFDRGLAVVRPYDFAEQARKTPFFEEILPQMLDFYETDHYIFVHGWIPCERMRAGYAHFGDWRTASDERWRDARWINGMAAFGSAYGDKTIVCGHWHASFGHAKIDGKGEEFGPTADFTPFYGAGIIAMDACTAVSGFVNCIVVDD